MGDTLRYRTVIRNDQPVQATGIVAWLSLIQTDPGQEQPVDLEDWSAHKAETFAELAPGKSVDSVWPIRLIQVGHYRVAVSASSGRRPSLGSVRCWSSWYRNSRGGIAPRGAGGRRSAVAARRPAALRVRRS